MKKLQIVSITLAALLLAGCGAAESAVPASESASEAASTVETAPAAESESETPAAEAALPDGVYTADFNTDSSMFHANESCDGKGTLTVADGQMTMLIDGEKYLPINTEGNSTFEIPVAALDTALAVTADTVAMSTPHEIDYTLTFASATLAAAE